MSTFAVKRMGELNTADYLLELGNDQDIALLAGRASYTYAELRRACSRMLAELLSRGVSSGDRVGILGENSLFWIAAYLASLKLGAVAVPFPTVSTQEDFVRNADFIDCRAMCVDQKSASKVSECGRQNPRYHHRRRTLKPGSVELGSGFLGFRP